MRAKIIPNEPRSPAGRLAEVELHFEEGALAGLKLLGFAVWESRGGSDRIVTFPARQYSVNGERRSFALLRPIVDVRDCNAVKELILAAFAAMEQSTSVE